jgi:hypothetical protein
MGHRHKFALKRNFVHETICPKEAFNPKSFRSVRTNGDIVTIGCPKRHWSGDVCEVGTRSQRLLHEVRHFKRKYPKKYKMVEKVGRRGVMLSPTPSAKRSYCPI